MLRRHLAASPLRRRSVRRLRGGGASGSLDEAGGRLRLVVTGPREDGPAGRRLDAEGVEEEQRALDMGHGVRGAECRLF
jgi:hypothetical protein